MGTLTVTYNGCEAVAAVCGGTFHGGVFSDGRRRNGRAMDGESEAERIASQGKAEYVAYAPTGDT